eukprot:13230781-Alexandrium_andersonii.AAC.1
MSARAPWRRDALLPMRRQAQSRPTEFRGRDPFLVRGLGPRKAPRVQASMHTARICCYVSHSSVGQWPWNTS